MANSWKCPRCSTANEATAVTCAKCGLFRGSVVLPTATPERTTGVPEPGSAPEPAPTALEPRTVDSTSPTAEFPDTPGWIPPDAGQDSGEPRPIWRRIPAGWLIVGLFLALGAVLNWYTGAGRSDTGEINKAGEISVEDLRVGDCFDLANPEEEEVDTLAARPCAEEHQYEAFFVGSMPAGDYPADAGFEEYVAANCDPAFTAYVGRSIQESALEYDWLYPTSDGWQAGDRSIQCVAYDPQADRLTESVRNANR